ncbi:hypothetical protein ACYOEI_22355, partial [Singulisphaera rosea]
MLVLVAVCATFMAAFLYRRGVYDPTYARARQIRYANADGKIAAIREIIDSDVRELTGSGASDSDLIESLLTALDDADPAVRAAAVQAMAVAIQRDAAHQKPNVSLAGPVKAALTEA